MSFLDAARPGADALRTLPLHARVRLVAHADADGIAAAAVLVTALRRLRRTFYVTYAPDHDVARVQALADDPYEANVFLDIGATWTRAIDQLPGRNLVLDHHPIRPPAAPATRVLHLNPHLDDASRPDEASGSTLALALAVALDPANWDAAPAALAGAWADGLAGRGFSGWNRTVLDEAVQRGFIDLQTTLSLPEGPLGGVLQHPPAPLSALHWSPQDVERFLQRTHLPLQATPRELPRSDQERLASALVLEGLRAQIPAHELRGLFHPMPFSRVHDGTAISRLARLATAAAREEEPGLALAFLLGDRTARADLGPVEARYHETIRQQLRRPNEQWPTPRDHVQVVEVTAHNYVGEVAGLAMHLWPSPTRPTLAFSRTQLRVRASARGTPEQVRNGLDLGEALFDAAIAAGGNGGGHRIAGGAMVPPEGLDTFLERLDRKIGEQLGAGPP